MAVIVWTDLNELGPTHGWGEGEPAAALRVAAAAVGGVGGGGGVPGLDVHQSRPNCLLCNNIYYDISFYNVPENLFSPCFVGVKRKELLSLSCTQHFTENPVALLGFEPRTL